MTIVNIYLFTFYNKKGNLLSVACNKKVIELRANEGLGGKFNFLNISNLEIKVVETLKAFIEFNLNYLVTNIIHLKNSL